MPYVSLLPACLETAGDLKLYFLIRFRTANELTNFVSTIRVTHVKEGLSGPLHIDKHCLAKVPT